MNDRLEPFTLALTKIRALLRTGRYVLGEQLMITALSQELGLSSTPIREALSRLAGEGLIEDRRGMGYFAKRLDAVDLAELYGLQLLHLRGSLAQVERRWGGQGGTISPNECSGRSGGQDLVSTTELLFDRWVGQARNASLLRGHRLLCDRLAPVRRAEAIVFADIPRELDALAAVKHIAELDAALATYHDRRIVRASDVVSAMRTIPSAIASA